MMFSCFQVDVVFTEKNLFHLEWAGSRLPVELETVHVINDIYN